MQTLLDRTKQKSVVTVGGVQSNHCRGKFKFFQKQNAWVASLLVKKNKP